MYVCINACVPRHVYTYAYKHIYTKLYVCIQIYVHSHRHTHIYILFPICVILHICSKLQCSPFHTGYATLPLGRRLSLALNSLLHPSLIHQRKKCLLTKEETITKKITADQNLIISDCLLSNPKLSICSTITAFKSGRLKELGDPISAVTLHLLEMLGKVST